MEISILNEHLEGVTSVGFSPLPPYIRPELPLIEAVAYQISSRIHKMIHGMWESYNETLEENNARKKEDAKVYDRRRSDEVGDIREAIHLSCARVTATFFSMNHDNYCQQVHLNSAV